MNTLAAVLFEKIDEDFALADGLLALAPAGQDEWRPPWPGDAPFTLAALAAHLAESFGGICACFARLHPEPLRHWVKSETVGLSVAESRELVATYRRRVREAHALTVDADLARAITTYFVPAGEPFLAILLTNTKHTNHHAHQLFTYLKLLGVPVGTQHLYRFAQRPR